MRKPRRLSDTFVRQGTSRNVKVVNNRHETPLAKVHVLYRNSWMFVYKGTHKGDGSAYWELIHKCQIGD